MAECMTFPEYISDFLNEYSFNDSEQVYTNGSEIIQVFRVMQALEHYAPELVENLHNKIQCKDCQYYWKEKGWCDKLSIWAEDEHYCAKGKYLLRCKDCKYYNTACMSEGSGWCEKLEMGANDTNHCDKGKQRGE